MSLRMFLFIIIFLSIYGSLHAYVFWKARKAFEFKKWTGAFLALLMGLMVVCPIMVRIVERQGFEHGATVLAYVGYIWMGFLVIFVSTAWLLDLYGVAVRLMAWIGSGFGRKWILSHKAAFLIALFTCFAGGLYSLMEAAHVQTEHLVIRSPKIPESLGRVRIVQISDVHLGLIIGERHLSRILQAVRAANPDILVSTGDLLDGQIDGIDCLARELQKIKPPLGKFAVNGNHEYYVGIDKGRDFCRAAGFTLLNDESFHIPGVLVVAGTDDPAARRFGFARELSEEKRLMELPKNRFVLLLKHRPLLEKGSQGLFDLQLSGHTHQGQIFPFRLVLKTLFPTDGGLCRLPDNSVLYVNRGSGTWGPPMRLFSPPEVTIIDLLTGERPEAKLVLDPDGTRWD